VATVLIAHGLDADEVFRLVDTGEARAIIANDWRHYHDDLDVFGVPTFVFNDDDAVFLRLMDGPSGDDAKSAELIEGLLTTMTTQSTVNELKHTRLSR
jgi:protein-disulfide isomerase-like protein with CxxC motif